MLHMEQACVVLYYTYFLYRVARRDSWELSTPAVHCGDGFAARAALFAPFAEDVEGGSVVLFEPSLRAVGHR